MPPLLIRAGYLLTLDPQNPSYHPGNLRLQDGRGAAIGSENDFDSSGARSRQARGFDCSRRERDWLGTARRAGHLHRARLFDVGLPVREVMVDGAFLLRDGSLTTLDYRAACDSLETQYLALRERREREPSLASTYGEAHG